MIKEWFTLETQIHEVSKMKLSDRLKLYRRQKGLTQIDVARKLNINNTTYASYELRDTQPKIERLKEIANILGVTLDELAGVNEFDRYIGYLSSYGVYAREQDDYIEIYECEIPWGAEIWGDAPEDSKLPLRIKKDSFLEVMPAIMEDIRKFTRPLIADRLYSLLVLPLERQAHEQKERQAHELPKIKK